MSAEGGGACESGRHWRSIIAGRILIVDDDPLVSAMLGKALPDLGYDVECSPSGDQAVALLRESVYDLVILDLAMPGISGIELIAAMRAERPAVPLVVLSGFIGLLEEKRLREMGVDAVLRKPARIGPLTAAIDEAIKSARGRES